MKIKWEEPLTDFDGQQVTDEEGKTVTLGRMAIRALMSIPPQSSIEGDEKFRRYKVAEKIHLGNELSVDELATVKKVAGEMLTPLAVGAIWKAIESAK